MHWWNELQSYKEISWLKHIKKIYRSDLNLKCLQPIQAFTEAKQFTQLIAPLWRFFNVIVAFSFLLESSDLLVSLNDVQEEEETLQSRFSKLKCFSIWSPAFKSQKANQRKKDFETKKSINKRWQQSKHKKCSTLWLFVRLGSVQVFKIDISVARKWAGMKA